MIRGLEASDTDYKRLPQGESTAVQRVRIVTDSIADIPHALATDLQITIVPCQVYFGQQTYLDGVDLSPQAFFNKLARSSTLPRTSQPQVGHLLDAYQRLLQSEHCEAVISIHVAGNLSGTVNAAWAAAQMLPDPSRVEVVDSGQISMGLGWAVVQAARLARADASPGEVSHAVRTLQPRLRTIAMIDALENLYKGGRINQVTATLGTALQIKPLLNVSNGEVTVWGRVRTRSKAIMRLVAQARSWGALAEMAVMHTGAEALASALADTLQDLVPVDRIIISPAGSALATHVGLGAVGLCALVANGQDSPVGTHPSAAGSGRIMAA